VNVGDTPAFTIISIVTGTAQPDEGVNVYVVVPVADILMFAGLHVPEILLFDVAGNAGAVEF
jgi:hypothetical protein